MVHFSDRTEFGTVRVGRTGIYSYSSATMPPTQTYRLFARAIIERKQILCRYEGHPRELCPIILGHSQGQEKALTYQFGGSSNSGLPPGGEWRCLWLSKLSEVQLRDGAWHSGASHTQPQGCVEIVDLDVNPRSPYAPKRPVKKATAKRTAIRARKPHPQASSKG
jgi:hypothetical protein